MAILAFLRAKACFHLLKPIPSEEDQIKLNCEESNLDIKIILRLMLFLYSYLIAGMIKGKSTETYVERSVYPSQVNLFDQL